MTAPLLVAPCEHDAAAFACKHWHYSRCVPAGKLIKYGVWEAGEFIGVVLYGRGSNKNLAASFDVDVTEICELVRIALRQHAAPVTRIVAESLRQLTDTNPGLRVVLSYADPDQQHVGRIYQAGNWVYLGRTEPAQEYIVNGERMHGRSLRALRNSSGTDYAGFRNVVEWAQRYIDPDARMEFGSSKHRYAYPLDRQMRRRLRRRAMPYPAGVDDGELLRSVALNSDPPAE